MWKNLLGDDYSPYKINEYTGQPDINWVPYKDEVREGPSTSAKVRFFLSKIIGSLWTYTQYPLP